MMKHDHVVSKQGESTRSQRECCTVCLPWIYSRLLAQHVDNTSPAVVAQNSGGRQTFNRLKIPQL